MGAGYWSKIKSFNRETRIVVAIQAVGGFVYGGIWSVLSNLFILRLGYGTAFIGTVLAAMLATQAVLSLPAGALSVALGPRRTLVLSLVLMLLSGVASVGAELIPAAWRQPYVLVVAIVFYAGITLYSVCAAPLLAGVTSAEERPHAFALLMCLMSVGGFLGGLVAGQLPGLFGRLTGLNLTQARPYGLSLLAGYLLLAPTIWLASNLPEQRVERKERVAARGPTPYALLLVIGLIGLLRCAGESTARSFYSVYLDQALGVSTARIGLGVSLGNLLAVAAPLLMPLLVQRLGKLYALVVSVLGLAACIAWVGLGGGWPMVALAYVLLIAVATLARSAWMLFSQEVVAPELRPLTTAANNVGIGVGSAILSAAGGYMAAALGYGSLYGVSAATVALGALTAWAYFGRRRRVAEAASAAD